MHEYIYFRTLHISSSAFIFGTAVAQNVCPIVFYFEEGRHSQLVLFDHRNIQFIWTPIERETAEEPKNNKKNNKIKLLY